MAKARLIKRRRRLRMEGVLVLMLIVSTGLYALSKICLNSYNIVLSNEQQQTAAQLSEVQNSVNVLKADVNELQDRSRVLAMVEEDGINTNQENIYVVGDGDEQ
ncbi:MAG: cell division protein FtsL [Merdibacter sp.]